MERGKLSVKDLEKLVDEGEIDTVLCMFTDLQGRYMGKRILQHFFQEEVRQDAFAHVPALEVGEHAQDGVDLPFVDELLQVLDAQLASLHGAASFSGSPY